MSNSFNAKALKVDDVNHAYDLLTAHFAANANLVGAGQTPESHATSLLHSTLKEQKYGLADNIPTLIRSYVAKRTKDAVAVVTPATARPLARDLFTLITGVSIDVGAAATPAAANTSVPAATPDSKDGSMTAAAPAASAPDASVATPASTVAASGIGGVTIPDAMAGAINTTLAQVSNGRARSVQALIEAVKTAETLIGEQDKAKAWGAAKLNAYKAGDIETAESAEFNIPAFKASGFADLKVEGAMVPVLDTLLTQATGGAISKFQSIVDAIAAAEKIASEKAAELRSLSRDIKLAQPKQKIAVSTGSEEQGTPNLECEIVMRKASEIFTNSFGASSPILDFDVPVIEWIGDKNPDVPEVDQTFRFYAPVLADALDCLVNGENMWLFGESGCGKSEFWKQVAARLNFPFFRLNMDSHLTRADMVGTNRLVPGPTGAPIMTFVEGLIPRALRVPSILLFDELDLGDPEIMPVLQPVLEGQGIRLLEDAGRYVAPHPWSRLAITANTIGLGSANQMYLNAHEQSAATRDRVARYVSMPYLPADMELEVCMARVPDANQDFAQKVIQLANKVRDGYRLGEIHQVFSTRTVLRAIRRHTRFAPLYGDETQAIHSTLECTVLNRCDDNSRNVVKGIIDNIF